MSSIQIHKLSVTEDCLRSSVLKSILPTPKSSTTVIPTISLPVPEQSSTAKSNSSNNNNNNINSSISGNNNYRRGSFLAGLTAVNPDAFDVARRRISNVSDVVSKKISKTIGWKTGSQYTESLVSKVGTLV